MIKLFALLPKRRDISLERYHEHWSTTHRDHALRMRALQRYVQCHRIEDLPQGFPPAPFGGVQAAPYPGIAEAWFVDLASAAGMGEDPDYTSGALLDEPNFIDTETMKFLLTTETVVIDGPRVAKQDPSIKVLLLMRRASSMTPEEFRQRWHEQHSALARQIPGLTRYVESHAVPESYDGGEAPPYDGVGELWWTGREALETALSSSRWSEAVADAAEFVGPGSAALLMDEYRVIWPEESHD